MRVALDTNRYVDLCKGVDETVALLEEADAVMLSFVVLGELRAGFAHGRRQAENERTLRRFLLKDGVDVLFADDQTTTPRSSVNFASKAHQFRRTTCGSQRWYCSTTLLCTRETSTSITFRSSFVCDPRWTVSLTAVETAFSKVSLSRAPLLDISVRTGDNPPVRRPDRSPT
jgi:hypothetical protein